MDIEIIKQIAKEVGVNVYGPMKIVPAGKGYVRFEVDDELTLFGWSLVNFANAIEKYVKKGR